VVHTPCAATGTPHPVPLTAKSTSWAEAKDNMDIVERCHQLKPEMIDVVQKALEENSQVSGAWGVPERIKRLINIKGS